TLQRRSCFGGLRRQQFSAQIQSPKDFTLRQGGKRSDGRSIQKYVTDARKSSQRRISVKELRTEHKEF
ncbi:hypothetical protein, partial [Salmonella enterica]|uniref:hypothetical protein n=1 Tax=Salmonella enterica TaxID=28901 RepID=UPI001CA6C27C